MPSKTKLYVYNTVILLLGLSLASTLIYGFAHFDKGESVSQHMIVSMEFRLLLSIQLLFQLVVWTLCAYSKMDIAPDIVSMLFISLAMVLIGWSGLSIFLSGTAHYVFTAIAISNIAISIYLVSRVTWQETPRYVIFIGFIPFASCIISMLVLLGTSTLYIPEYLAFIFYSLFFSAFFLAHPYYDWARMPEECDLYKQVP